MPAKPASQLQKDVTQRLRAIQAELGLSDEAMARHVGASGRTSWNNWINARNMPDEAAMVRLCELERVTMEWLYRGIVDGMPVGRAIRLEARCRGIDPSGADPSILRPVPAFLPDPATAETDRVAMAAPAAGPSRARRKDVSVS